MERCNECKCSPCKCASRCSHILAPLAVLAIAVVILLGNLGVISAYVTSILWPILLGVAALFKILCCAKDAKMDRHCPPCRCDRCLAERGITPPRV